MASEALGLLETRGLVALMEGTDAILKAANVRMSGWQRAGSGLVTVIVRGDVASVKAAVNAGHDAAARVGAVVSAHVIVRPHEDLASLVPGTQSKGASGNAPAKPPKRR